MITTNELFRKYGRPSENGSPYLKSINLPYPMTLAWDRSVKVNRMRCHKLVEENFLNVFNAILHEYGTLKIQQLGIDLFGGCFNYRKMRGGSDWSRHCSLFVSRTL